MTEHARPPAQPETPFPWDIEDPEPPADPGGKRQRHDAFTDARKHVFLKALIKTGCVLDACRATGIVPKTAYRHQESDPRFAHNCRTALRMAATPLELAAWTRAVEGVEREFACGGQVHVRRIYSDSLLRLLLQGANPKKYGARPGFTRKRMARAERKHLRREIEAELRFGAGKGAPERPFPEVVESIMTKIEAIERHEEPQRLAAGWTKTPDDHWLPPGYGWTGPGAEPGPGEGWHRFGEPPAGGSGLPGLPGGPGLEPPGDSL